jgi:hypothetical protein
MDDSYQPMSSARVQRFASMAGKVESHPITLPQPGNGIVDFRLGGAD